MSLLNSLTFDYFFLYLCLCLFPSGTRELIAERIPPVRCRTNTRARLLVHGVRNVKNSRDDQPVFSRQPPGSCLFSLFFPHLPPPSPISFSLFSLFSFRIISLPLNLSCSFSYSYSFIIYTFLYNPTRIYKTLLYVLYCFTRKVHC